MELTKINFKPSFFSDRPIELLSDGEFSAVAFRYETGVCGLKIRNKNCNMVVLPYMGQQIWFAEFHGKNLTQKSIFDQPQNTTKFGDNYGGLLIHCGLTNINCADEGEDYPLHEQLKFYMVANYLMYKNGEFEEYDRYNKEMESYLAEALVQVEKDSDEWAYEYAKNKVDFWKKHPDLPHYFIGSGNQYGATYSYAMCYWEEQMWIRTKSISCQEFFHGMQEIIVDDTPVTLFMGEDEQRPLAERVARFLPKVNANYTIIDTKEQELKGISPEFRGSISHLVMHGVNNRVDAYMELFLRHPLSIRRYYRQFEY